MKVSFRRRALYFVVFAVLVIIVLRLTIHRSGAPFVTYSSNYHVSNKEKLEKLILLWTPFFSTKDYITSMRAIGCPELRCNVTSNRSFLDHSDAVIFHARDTHMRDLPAQRFSWQRWVLLHHESPHHTPDFFKQLDGLINWTITYRLDSDVILSPKVRKLEEPIPQSSMNYAKNKTRMAVWFVSNCNTPSNREAYVKELQKTLSVDIIGSCGGRECVPKMSPKCYEDAARDFRFYLSFENSICKDYITEKFYHVLSHPFVPVVLGGADYSKMAPPDSYINALSFDSPRALGKFLLDLAKDEKRYNGYFKWKDEYETTGEHYACRLCRKLLDEKEPVKVWHNLHEWWFGTDGNNCQRWPLQDASAFPT